ncbi:Imm50 family immunity protein [Streptomyces sp. NPDC007971]|uniref:Imm50 family immunity protein n=1 Tax=Streptomyces sp. NPDC007971 TaxID=3364799 RepID=UPI0036DFCB85
MTNPEGINRIYQGAPPSLSGIRLHQVVLGRDGPEMRVRLDLPDYPARPPRKWAAQGFNTVQIELAFGGLRSITLDGFGTDVTADISLTGGDGISVDIVGTGARIQAVSDSASIAALTAYVDGARHTPSGEESDLARGLTAAGLKYLGMVGSSVPVIPPHLASFANSTATEGKEWAVSVENDAPDFQQRVNHEWYMLCAHQGLFDPKSPQFLIAVRDTENDHAGAARWARVALQMDWDFAGAGAEARVTGCGWGHPEFVMLSLDGNVIARGSQGQEWTDFVCLKNPHRVPSLRALGARLAESRSTSQATRDALARWLEHTSVE